MTRQISVEVMGFVLAVIAAIAIVGLTLGVSSVVSHRLSIAPPGQAVRAVQQFGKSSASNAVESSRIIQGRSLFADNCSSCHGDSAEGAFGPSLRSLDTSDSVAIMTIKNGAKGKMPPFGNKLSESNIQAIIAYLHSLKGE